MKFIGHIFGKLLKIILIILLLVVILTVALYLCAGKLIQSFAPEIISQVTQTETSLGEVDISLLSGRLALNNLTIGNPAGFKDKNVLELGNISVSFDPKSIFTDKLIVNNVLVDGVHVSTELNEKGKTNVAELLNNVNQFIAARAEEKTSEAVPEAKNDEKAKAPVVEEKASQAVVVQDLRIVNSSVRAGIAGQMMDVALPEIQQKNIGENKKQTLADIVIGVLNVINVESSKAVLNATKDALKNNIETGKGAIESIKDTFKNLF